MFMASVMHDTDFRAAVKASTTATLAQPAPRPRARATSHSLSPEAIAVAAKPSAAPISSIVLAGFVRMAEFVLIIAIGLAVYAAYLPEIDGLIWRYLLATFSIAVLSMLAFQVADIYQVQAFRGHEKQYMRLASAWSVVFLLAIGVSFFAKAGEMFSRIWLGTF
jgi:putative exporter of polyketide antibiotics